MAADQAIALQIDPQRYVDVPDDPGMSDVTARVEADGKKATIILVYFLGEPTPANGGGPMPGDEGGPGGGMDPDYHPAMVRPMARCTLEIQKTGDATWKIEKTQRHGWENPARRHVERKI